MVGAGFVAFPNSFQCACSPLAHQRVCCMMTLFCLAALTMTVMLVAFVCRPCGFISLSLTPPLHFVARWAEAGGGGGFFWSCFGWRRHGQLALGGVVLWGPFCSISRGREGGSKEGGEGGKRRGGLPFQRGVFFSFFLSFFFFSFLVFFLHHLAFVWPDVSFLPAFQLPFFPPLSLLFFLLPCGCCCCCFLWPWWLLLW